MRLMVENIRILDPQQDIDQVTNLYVARGRILGIGKEAPEGFEADRIINGTGKWLFPGLVDLQARLAEPGSHYEGTIASETKAAVSGGITTICCPPDTMPVNDSQAVTELIQRRARQAATAFVLPIGAITKELGGQYLSNMAALKNAGCIALSQANSPIQNSLTLKNAMAYAASNDILLMLRSENKNLKNNGVAHSGVVSSRLGLTEIPASAETAALARDLILVEETGVRAHFSLISTARSVEMIADAKKHGLPVTCDVAAHQLHLTEYDVMDFDSLFHVTPPLRSHDDKAALRIGLKMGVIDAIVSDHTPLDRDDKLLPFGESAPGISSLETLLALTLKLVEEDVLDLNQALAKVTNHPANIIGLHHGSLETGNSADFCIFDPETHWTLERKEMISKGDNSPFQGWEFRGQIEATYFQGRPVYQNNPV
ncbi:dihydroorotase [Hydrogenovibrio marinus]|uniref:Dihydroorotase n=1 Tax=Hydrogenovibrio marinus TaxID=28885 RepID=A0A066ZTW4_HYDMR|nr:dihydroorotase [Hydrogenovibrio marinus]KDN95684.1 dihydroorotase [Hydrogenovibrio marinus]BBN58836.1 dihydroorotase [Hydrogenovibrio marinus]